MRVRDIIVFCILFSLVSTTVSGCISSEGDSNIFDGDLEDLLISPDLLPEGWYEDTSFAYGNPESSEEMIEKGYLEAIGTDFFSQSVGLTGNMNLGYLHQSAIRYDSEDLKSVVDEDFDFLVQWYTAQCYEGDTGDGWDGSEAEEVGTPAVGDYSKALKVSIFNEADGPGEELEVSTQYYVYIVKKDIILSFHLREAEGINTIDLNYVLNLAKNITNNM